MDCWKWAGKWEWWGLLAACSALWGASDLICGVTSELGLISVTGKGLGMVAAGCSHPLIHSSMLISRPSFPSVQPRCAAMPHVGKAEGGQLPCPADACYMNGWVRAAAGKSDAELTKAALRGDCTVLLGF